ncbi:MAG: GNAT family N-acetyltransferase [Rhodovibrionaceae bacterium]
MTTIRPARSEDCGLLTDLALRSKAVWGYDAAFMEACREELTIRPEMFDSDVVTVIEAEGTAAGKIAGFYRLRLERGVVEIYDFFIDPEHLRQGYGKRLWRKLLEDARGYGVKTLGVDADPQAEAFYTAMGMKKVGKAPSGSIPGRFLPRLTMAL